MCIAHKYLLMVVQGQSTATGPLGYWLGSHHASLSKGPWSRAAAGGPNQPTPSI